MKTAYVALKLLLVMTIITGVLYPLIVTLIARATFPDQASGSMIVHDGKIVGSRLIGQKFESDKYFWSRPSAIDYNPLPSGGSNLGYTSGDLKKLVADRGSRLTQTVDTILTPAIPVDLLFASASGLDPHISPEAAEFQVQRVLHARRLDETNRINLINLIDSLTEQRDLGVLGEPHVNVLMLNLALDSLYPEPMK
jgi:potassium-transporting ATPase KdpC subunit